MPVDLSTALAMRKERPPQKLSRWQKKQRARDEYAKKVRETWGK